jgi:hypothetical protein
VDPLNPFLTFLSNCLPQLQKEASKELDHLQKAKEINFVLEKKPFLPISEYLERSHKKHFMPYTIATLVQNQSS